MKKEWINNSDKEGGGREKKLNVIIRHRKNNCSPSEKNVVNGSKKYEK